MKKKQIFHLLCFIAIAYAQSVYLHAQPLTFSKVIYDNPGYGIRGFSVVEAPDNRFMIVGEGEYGKGFLMKIDSAGNALWNKTLDVNNALVYPNARFRNIITTIDSNYVICGAVLNNSTASLNAFCAKINSVGDTIWTRTLGDGEAYEALHSNDSGFVVIAGIGIPSANIVIIKLDPGGNLQWGKKISIGNNTNAAHAVKQTADNGYLITGYTENGPPFYGGVFLLKMDSSGTVLWLKRYYSFYNSLISGGDFEITSDGILCLLTTGFMKTDSVGNVLWCKKYNGYVGDFPETPSKLFALSDHNYAAVTVGESKLIKIDSAGNILWSKALFLSATDGIESADTGLFILGNGPLMGINPPRVLSPQIGIIKTDSLGNAAQCITSNSIFASNDSIITASPAFNIQSMTTSSQLPLFYDSLILVTDSGCVDFSGGVEEENYVSAISLYPNPPSAQVSISSRQEAVNKIEIYNSIGEQIYSLQPETGNEHLVTIGVAGFPPGIYFVRMVMNKGIRTVKFVKQ